MKNYLLIAFLLILTVSCYQESKDKEHLDIELIEKALEIPLNNKTSNISRGLQAYSDNDNELLFNINWGQNSLQIYDIASGDFIKEIFFQSEGDKAVGRIFGFHIHNLDSIFLFNQQSSEIVMMDTANTIKSRIEYNPPEGYSNAFVHNAYFISHPILKGNELIVKTHLQGDYQKMTDEELEQKLITYSINLENGSVELLPQKYPEDYLNKGLKFYEYSMAANANQIVFSLLGDHRLFYSSINDEKELQASLVKTFTLDNLLFVARTIFPNRNITTFGSIDLQNIIPNNSIDDVSLLRFGAKYNLLEDNSAFQNLADMNIVNQLSRSNLGPDEPPRLGGQPCALAVSNCHNGSDTRTNCQAFGPGCVAPPNCSYSATTSSLQMFNMNSEYNTFTSYLPTHQLYSFRNWLETKPKGQFYSDAFYSMASHFQASLDTDLLIDIVSSSNKMSNFVNALNNNDTNYTLNQTDFNSFVSIANKSKSNSNSQIYIDLLNTLIDDVQVYKSKNVAQIKSIASEPMTIY
ncbi:MAG: DUF4221 family protein [Bacteroidota bacterium]